MTTEQLKPCPFCKGWETICKDPSNKDALCQCHSCGTWASVAVWQSRPIEDALRAKLAIAVEALEALSGFSMRLQNGVVIDPSFTAKEALERIGKV